MSIDLNEVVGVVRDTVKGASSRLAVCAAARISCEGWLKVELLHALAVKFSDVKSVGIFPEQNHVDLVLADGQRKVLVELKTFPCNYGGSGKPITKFIESVVRDLEKLRLMRTDETNCIVVWVAYTIPEKIPDSWSKHLSKIQGAASVTLCIDTIQLWPGKFAHLHIMEPMI